MTATMALYWIDVIYGIDFMLGIIEITCFIFSILAFLDALGCNNWRTFKISFVSMLCFGVLSLPFPSKNTMYMMLATHYAGESQLPEKVLKAIEVKLDEIIGEKE